MLPLYHLPSDTKTIQHSHNDSINDCFVDSVSCMSEVVNLLVNFWASFDMEMEKLMRND